MLTQYPSQISAMISSVNGNFTQSQATKANLFMKFPVFPMYTYINTDLWCNLFRFINITSSNTKLL